MRAQSLKPYKIKTVDSRVDLMASGPPKPTPRNLFVLHSRPSISNRKAAKAVLTPLRAPNAPWRPFLENLTLITLKRLIDRKNFC